MKDLVFKVVVLFLFVCCCGCDKKSKRIEGVEIKKNIGKEAFAHPNYKVFNDSFLNQRLIDFIQNELKAIESKYGVKPILYVNVWITNYNDFNSADEGCYLGFTPGHYLENSDSNYLGFYNIYVPERRIVLVKNKTKSYLFKRIEESTELQFKKCSDEIFNKTFMVKEIPKDVEYLESLPMFRAEESTYKYKIQGVELLDTITYGGRWINKIEGRTSRNLW